MKKVLSLFVLLFFIASIFAVVGEQGSNSNSDSSDDLDDVSEEVEDEENDNSLELTDEVESEASNQPSVETCIRYLKGKFPNANIERLGAACKRLKTQVMIENKGEEKLGARIRLLNEERLKAISELDDGKKRFWLGMDSEVKLRLAKLDDSQLRKLANLTQEQMEKLKVMSRERLRELSEKNNSEIREELSKMKIKKIKVENLFRKRIIAEDNLKAARERFETAKEKYSKAKSDFAGEKKAFLDAIKAKNETAAMEHAKLFLTDAADVIINYLEKVKSRVEDNDDLTEEEAAEIIAEIDEKISEIEDAKEDIENADTKEELKEAGKVIVNAWARMKHRVRLHVANILKSNVRDILERAEHLETKLDKALAKLEEKGYDISGIDDKVDEFSEKIDDAREKFKTAQEKIREARELREDNESTQEEIDALVDDAKELVKDAHNDLKDAHELLKEIVKSIRETTGTSIDLSEEDEVEIEVEEEDSE